MKPALALAAALAIAAASDIEAAGRGISLELHGRRVEANIVAHQGGVCWLSQSDGTYTAVRVKDVRDFRPLPRPVKPLSTLQLRAEMRKEFGRDYDIGTSGRHLVVADRAIADRCARRCESVARAFRTYFNRRSVPLKASDYPLVVVVVRSQQEFQKRAALEGVTADPTLMGYYLRTSNRVLMFDTSNRLTSGDDTAVRSVRTPGAFDRRRSALDVEQLAVRPTPSIAGADFDGTLVHETVHQLAFNMGLHNRTGGNPKWVVEGLATMLEPDAVRKNLSSIDSADRLNSERMLWYVTKTRPNWNNGRLAEIVASDARFDTDTLDAYAEAWSLSFFLSETRGANYARYLKSLAQRRELHLPSERERLDAFTDAFGANLAQLEIRWLRFMSQMATRFRP